MTGKHVFLDTMVFIHYKPIEDTDWCGLLGVPEILLVPRITIRELDKNKNTNPSTKLRERAASALKRLEDQLSKPGTEIRQGVRVARYARLPSMDLPSIGLDPFWADDILIATLLQYREDNKNDDVVLVTQDTGPRLTAADHGIATWALPDECKLPSELDSAEKEIQTLKKELLQHQAAKPELKLIFCEAPSVDHIEYQLVTVPWSDESAARLVEEERKKHPKQKVEDQQTSTLMGIITPQEIERYNSELEKYFSEFARFIRKQWEFEEVQRRTIELCLRLANGGGQPAEDIDFALHFPDGLTIHRETHNPEPPRPPSLPVRARSNADMFADMMGGFRAPLFVPPPIPDLGSSLLDDLVPRNVGPLRIKKTNSYEVTGHISRVKHGDHEDLPPIAVRFDAWPPLSFHIDYLIRPVNLAQPVVGQVHVKVIDSHG